jgi:hypothetical protein
MIYTPLNGANISSVSRYGDAPNKISIGSVGVFAAKDLFKESMPFSFDIDNNGSKILTPNLHFLAEVRRQLSGVEEEGTSTFGPVERIYYEEFIKYQSGIEVDALYLEGVEALDDWLIEELIEDDHFITDRIHSTDKWYKTEDRPTATKGITWL